MYEVLVCKVCMKSMQDVSSDSSIMVVIVVL